MAAPYTEIDVSSGTNLLTVRELPLDQIVVREVNVRQIDEADPDFWQLVDSIRQYGQLTPVWVGREESGYRLIAGERRYRALQKLEASTIRALVLDIPREEWTVLMLIENLQRQQLEAWEEAAGYQLLLDRGWTLSEVASRVGKPISHISVVLKVTRNPRICAALQERAISTLSLARELSPLLKSSGEEVQEGLLDQALEFIRRSRPTVAVMRQWVQSQLSFVAQETTVPSPHRSSLRMTPVRAEEQRLRHIEEHVIPQLSVREASALADLYEEFATLVRESHGNPALRISGETHDGEDQHKKNREKADRPSGHSSSS